MFNGPAEERWSSTAPPYDVPTARWRGPHHGRSGLESVRPECSRCGPVTFRPILLIERYVEASNAGDLDAALADTSPHYEYADPTSGGLTGRRICD
jgi:hypothetical protein